MKLILNIGTERSTQGVIDPGGRVGRMDVETALAAAGVKLLSIEHTYPVGSEPTWVCVAEAAVPTVVYNVSVALDQDCIAVGYYEEAVFNGTLVGPRTQEWGTFNPTLFVMPKVGKV